MNDRTGRYRLSLTGSAKRVLIRVSWVGDALTIRAKPERGSFQLVRVLPFEPGLVTFAGPYICAPTRAGLTVPFHSWRVTAA